MSSSDVLNSTMKALQDMNDGDGADLQNLQSKAEARLSQLVAVSNIQYAVSHIILHLSELKM